MKTINIKLNVMGTKKGEFKDPNSGDILIYYQFICDDQKIYKCDEATYLALSSGKTDVPFSLYCSDKVKPKIVVPGSVSIEDSGFNGI